MPTFEVSNVEYYTRSKDEVWSELMRFFTSNNLQIKTIEKDSGIIYAENMQVTPSDWGQNCLPGMFDTPAGGQLATNIFVAEMNEKESISVTVNTRVIGSFYALGANVPYRRDCLSNGNLERLVFDHLGNDGQLLGTDT